MVSLLTLSQNIHSTPRLPVYTVITELRTEHKSNLCRCKTVSWLKWFMMKRTLELREQKRATLDRECDLLEKVMGQGMLMEG